jgi:peptidoglycan/xylan/chitin deacetylase (PgdA/CDA1 family)
VSKNGSEREAGECLVVMYHYVRDSRATAFPEIRALAPDLFRRQLDWLQANYTVVTQADLEAAIDRRAPLPANAALLTFDDGFVDHFDTACAMLSERGLSGTFFLSQDACGPAPRLLNVHKTQFLLARLGAAEFSRAVVAELGAVRADVDGPGVFGADVWEEGDDRAVKHLLNYQLPFADADRVLDALFARHIGDAHAFAPGLYLDAAMVREMTRQGMTFGFHTRSHRMLSRLTPGEQAAELAGGAGWIRELTGQAAVPFCYPWGGPGTYTAATIEILRESGYSVAFNTERRRLRLASDGRYELPRLDTRDLPPYTAGEPRALAALAPAEDA